MSKSQQNKKIAQMLMQIDKKNASHARMKGGFPWLATLLPTLLSGVAGPLLSKGVDALGSKLGFGKSGGRRSGGRRSGGRRSGGSSPWIQHVKNYMNQHGCSYKEALSRASASYHK